MKEATLQIQSSERPAFVELQPKRYIGQPVYTLNLCATEGEDGWSYTQHTIDVDQRNAGHIVEIISQHDSLLALTAGDLQSLVDICTGDPVTEAKTLMQAIITAYDSSPAVNTFSYGGFAMWLDYDLRSRLRARLQAEVAAGHDTTKVWYGGTPFELDVAAAEQMLMAVEAYSAACFDVTESHKAAIARLDSVDDILGFDYKADYPAKLQFANGK